MKKLFLLLVLLVSSIPMSAQLALGYFPFNYSQVQLTTNPDRLVFGDLRMETNSFITNLNIELAPMFNLLRREEFNFYAGGGVNLNPLYQEGSVVGGYFMTTGVRWMPLSQMRALGFIFELSPLLYDSFYGAQLRSFLGVSYHFGKP